MGYAASAEQSQQALKPSAILKEIEGTSTSEVRFRMISKIGLFVEVARSVNDGLNLAAG